MNRWLWAAVVAGGIIMIFMGRRLVQPGLENMARAIMDFEGWFEGSAAQRNNNPGNIKFAGQPGAIGKDNQGHAIFETFEAGWNALINQLRIAFEGTSRVYNPSMSLYEFFSKYAEANSIPYAQFVAAKLGVAPETKLSEIT